VQEPMDIPGGPSVAMFADPQGNVIGLVKGM
jgi:predicted enzyme related to lactoylglutathione lyase